MKRALTAVLTVLILALSARAGYREVTLLEGVVPGADGKIDVVAIYPHQDDESFWSGGTLHRLKQDPRVRLHLVCLTRGDMSGAKDALAISGQRLGDIRVKELALAAQVYQADELIQFDYHDQGLAAVGDEVLIERLAGILDATGAEVVLTYGPDGVTAHPDHQVCSRVATAAWKRSGAQRLYYSAAPPWVTRLTRRHRPAPIMPTLKVDIRAEKKLKMLALYSHASQEHFGGGMGGAMGAVKLFNYEWFVPAGERRPGAAGTD